MSDETLTFGLNLKAADPTLTRKRGAAPKTASCAPVPDLWGAGDVIDGRYEVKEIVGQGGMGVVYRIFHQEWNISLGVKAMLPSLVADEPSKQRFIREAQTWIDLGMHPNIVQCWYVREIDGLLLLFLEFIKGGSLRAWLDAGSVRPKDWPQIIDFTIQAADGLGHAHDQGLVHRDVKPANMMMAEKGRLCVTDFGIVKASRMADIAGSAKTEIAGDGPITLTQADSGMGTPEYGAPEQWIEAQSVDARADIYALGVTLFELCCGKRPFDDGAGKEPPHVLIGRHLSQPPPDPRQVIPDTPDALANLILRCLAKDPENRPGSMNEVRKRLAEVYQAVFGSPYLRKKPAAADLRADSLNNKAVSLWDLGRKKDAVAVFKKTIQVDPQHLEATANLGLLEWRSGQTTDDGFLKRLQGLETVHGKQALFWRILGEAHLCRRAADEAVKALIKALDINPEDQFARQLLSKARKSVGTGDRHVRCFQTIKDVDPIVGLGFGPDGQSFAAAHPTGLKWWRLDAKYLSAAFGNQEYPINCMAVSSSGRACAAGNAASEVQLWDLKTKQMSYVFHGHQKPVNCVAFLPGKIKVLSGSSDATLRLWDHRQARPCLYMFEGHEGPVSCVAASGDGRFFISGELYKKLILWDLRARRLVRKYAGHQGSVTAAAILPNCKYFLSGDKGGTLRLWSVATGKCLRVLTGHADAITDIAISPDGQYAVTGSADKTLRLWRLASGACLRTFKDHLNAIHALSHSPKSSRLISGGQDRTIRFWNIRFDAWQIPVMFNISEIRDFQHIVGDQEKACQLLSQSAQRLSQGRASEAIDMLRSIKQIPGFERDRKVLDLWNKAAQNAVRSRVVTAWTSHVFRLHDGPVTDLDWHPDGTRAVSAGADKLIKLFDVKTGDMLRTFKGHSATVTSVRFSPDGRRLVSGSADKTTRLWSVASGQCERVFDDHLHPVTSAQFSHGGGLAMTTETYKPLNFVFHPGGVSRLWDLETGECLRVFEGHADGVQCATLTPDDQVVVTGGLDRTARVWDLASGKCVNIFEGHQAAVTAVAVSPEGDVVMSASEDQTIMLWELATGRGLKIFKPDMGPLRCLSLCENGRFAVMAARGALRVVHLSAGASLKLKILTETHPNIFLYKMEGHEKTVNAAAVSPDGRFVLSGGEDQTIRLWELDWELAPEGKAESLQEMLNVTSKRGQLIPAKEKRTRASYQHPPLANKNALEWSRAALQILLFLPKLLLAPFQRRSFLKVCFLILAMLLAKKSLEFLAEKRTEMQQEREKKWQEREKKRREEDEKARKEANKRNAWKTNEWDRKQTERWKYWNEQNATPYEEREKYEKKIKEWNEKAAESNKKLMEKLMMETLDLKNGGKSWKEKEKR